MMATILYHGEPNGPSFTVLAALAEKGVAAELKAIDLTKGERHSPAVPKNIEVEMSIEGEGPVLVADGEAMADSVFIACYLDDVGSGPAIRPADPYVRWEMMAWCRFVIERIAPAAAFLGTRAHLTGKLAALSDDAFAALTADIASDDLRGRWAMVRKGDFPEAQMADSESKIIAGVARVELRLENRDWLMGDFSIADLETYGWLAGMVSLVPAAFENAERTLMWMERVKARPAVATALAAASAGDPTTVWAPGPEINRWG
jgi:glutathione S-transferase